MAEAAVSSLVQLLGNLLIEKVKFLGSVGKEVEWLNAELQRMQCFLRDAEEKQTTNNSIRNWISDIRKVAFDAEDVIEMFIHNVEYPKKNTWMLERCACFANQVYYVDRVVGEIQSIRERLEAIKQSREAYGIKDLGERVDWTEVPGHVEWQRRLIPTQQENDVVGLDKDVHLLLEKILLDDRKSLSSVIIMGLPGIGKSTLARILYNHVDVVEQFNRRAWVVVSNDFQPKQIFKNLILELLEPSETRSKMLETIQHEEAPKLQQMLYERLRGKKYFIVLDDVWKDEHWTSLSNAFPVEEKGSKLLLTSRSRILTKYTRYTHPMRILEFEESWKLFLTKAITDNTEANLPKHLEYLGRQIVEKCDGLPLAINTVGGLLLKQGQSRSEWVKVLEGMKSDKGSNESVFRILELSYQNLTPQLKPCFLCLAFFREDAIIRAEKLKNIWISQGFIRQEGEERVEAIATRYLTELVNQNLIQVKDISSDDQIKSCQVHDLIREVSIRKAKEEMGLEMLTGKRSSQSPNIPRHRAHYCSLADDENSQNKHLRSLFVCVDITEAPSSYWKDFELLKLLDLEHCISLTQLPEAIGALIGLRYLGLKHTKITKLPRSFRKLKSLEVIELPDYVLLPSSAWNFLSLRYIDALVKWDKVPKRRNTLKHIYRLKSMIIGHSNLEKLAEMTNLRYLALSMYEPTDLTKVFSSLHKLSNLVWLTLESDAFPSMEGFDTLHHVTRLKIQGKMMELPKNFPPNVSHLTLKLNYLGEDPMPVLDKLPYLSYLSLQRAYVGENMVISDTGFPRLEILIFKFMFSLSSIQVAEDAMPVLKRVKLEYCTALINESFKEQLRSSVILDIQEYSLLRYNFTS